MIKTLLLLTPLTGSDLSRLRAIYEDRASIIVVQTKNDLLNATVNADTTLLSVGSGIIVEKDILSKLTMPAYNLHAASPEFPGRDPHHHAVYRGAKTYGATLHVMTRLVDAGAIVGVEMFAVGSDETPTDLLGRANEAGMLLLERLGPRLLDSEPLVELDGVNWGKIKTSRADFKHLTEITPLIDEAGFERFYKSFDGGAYDNLALRIHGKTFRIDKQNPLTARDGASFQDFTETACRDLLRQLKAGGYRFARYGEEAEDQHVIWRHDIDFSVHRAARLAAIEAEEGAVATYFVNPRCAFYNLLEPEVEALLHKIRDLGHEIGLHFDGSAYGVKQWNSEELVCALAREKSLLELVLDQPVRCVSWHNPDLSNLLEFTADEVSGMVNAYGEGLKRDYAYCSDSNGYWRFEAMDKVIAQGHQRLHLLTHPAWWVPEPMSPSRRIDRAIMGRARKVRADYDALLEFGKRKNVTD